MLRTNCFLVLLFCCVSLYGQNDSITELETTNTKIQLKYGLRIGADIAKLGRTFLDDEYSGFEIIGDFRLTQKLYIAGEIGFEEKSTITNYMDITTTGTYLKAGIDYNMYENWLDMDNMIFAGFRIGASTFSHDLNSATVYTTNQYWSPQLTSREKIEFSGLNAIWAEILLGIKAELFNNLYMGLNVQLKFLGTEKVPDNFGNVYIPGYHKNYDSSIIGVGYSYTLSYRIPFFKKDKVEKTE
ncbi:DUF6048 family protein [Cognatitamlana onchidii]|uniref:DUF6048 family protein n=1 Tax=Cognatitamlana onchidii TaxID=2562860 RepID=UPI001F239144|nr:DUF6048 family protein [Algibacter onchidii]